MTRHTINQCRHTKQPGVWAAEGNISAKPVLGWVYLTSKGHIKTFHLVESGKIQWICQGVKAEEIQDYVREGGTCIPRGSMGFLSSGAWWPVAALTQEPRGYGSGYWEDCARGAESSSLVQVRLRSSVPQLQSVVRLSMYSQVHAYICAAYTYTGSHTDQHRQTLSAHTNLSSTNNLVVLTSLAN